MIHKVSIRQPLDWHTPQEDLQEISMLEDEEDHENYKTPFSARDANFHLDGWVHTHPHLISFNSNVLDNAAHLKYKQQTQETGKTRFFPSTPEAPSSKHKHSASFSEAASTHPHNFLTARYHIRRVQSHEWESEEKPIHHFHLSNISNRSSTQHPSNIKNKDRTTFNESKLKVFQNARLMRRSSVDAVSYPVIQSNPERKIAGAVGRVRRMLKIKNQKRN